VSKTSISWRASLKGLPEDGGSQRLFLPRPTVQCACLPLCHVRWGCMREKERESERASVCVRACVCVCAR
jgi:hypothetical protein